MAPDEFKEHRPIKKLNKTKQNFTCLFFKINSRIIPESVIKMTIAFSENTDM